MIWKKVETNIDFDWKMFVGWRGLTATRFLYTTRGKYASTARGLISVEWMEGLEAILI